MKVKKSSLFADFFDFVGYIVYFFSLRKWWLNIPSKLNLGKFKKIHICGNGPSFSESVNDLMREKEAESSAIVCVNEFSKTKYYKELKPKFYIVSDSKFFKGFDGELVSDDLRDLFFHIINFTSWNLDLIIPSQYYHEVKRYMKDNTHINVIQYDNFGYFMETDFFRRIYFSISPLPPLNLNINLIALWYAINLKPHYIYLYGLDFSWFKNYAVTSESQCGIKKEHFYNSTSNIELTKYPLGIHFLRISWLYRSMYGLYHAGNNRGIVIINRTIDTLLDVIDRK